MKRLNRWLAVKITAGVGTMWCAYAFAALALYGLPAALHRGDLVQWFAQTFLQLVLLSILAVGQQVQSNQSERQNRTVHRVLAEHTEAVQEVNARLDAHHERLTEIHHHVTKPRPSGRTRKETAP